MEEKKLNMNRVYRFAMLDEFNEACQNLTFDNPYLNDRARQFNQRINNVTKTSEKPKLHHEVANGQEKHATSNNKFREAMERHQFMEVPEKPTVRIKGNGNPWNNGDSKDNVGTTKETRLQEKEERLASPKVECNFEKAGSHWAVKPFAMIQPENGENQATAKKPQLDVEMSGFKGKEIEKEAGIKPVEYKASSKFKSHKKPSAKTQEGFENFLDGLLEEEQLPDRLANQQRQSLNQEVHSGAGERPLDQGLTKTSREAISANPEGKETKRKAVKSGRMDEESQPLQGKGTRADLAEDKRPMIKAVKKKEGRPDRRQSERQVKSSEMEERKRSSNTIEDSSLREIFGGESAIDQSNNLAPFKIFQLQKAIYFNREVYEEATRRNRVEREKAELLTAAVMEQLKREEKSFKYGTVTAEEVASEVREQISKGLKEPDFFEFIGSYY
jgi:hypothetical protein